MLYKLKGPFQKVAEYFVTSGMTANQASFLGVVFIALTGLALYLPAHFSFALGHYWLAIPFILLRFIMNALDGLLARRLKTASVAGELFNELADVIGDSLSFAFLLFARPEITFDILILIIAMWFCEFIAVLAKSFPNGSRRQESFLGGKPERAVFLATITILLSLNFNSLFIRYCVWVITGLTFMTGLIRIRHAIKDSKGLPYESHTKYGK